MTKVSENKAASRRRISSNPKSQRQLNKNRNRVANLIEDASLDMTRRVVESVKKRGSFQALRYLWEVAGIFPKPAVSETEGQKSAAQQLIEMLSRYEEFPAAKTEKQVEG